MKDKLKAWEDINRLWGKCMDCERDYVDFQDLQIPDELWEEIKPTIFDGVGLLCPTCILNRLREIGIMEFKFEMEKSRIKVDFA